MAHLMRVIVMLLTPAAAQDLYEPNLGTVALRGAVSSISGNKVGDEWSTALDISLPGEGTDWKFINALTIASEMQYPRSNSRNPECMQGIVWMDQQCTTGYDHGGNCFSLYGLVAENEYVTAFGNFDWSARSLSFRRYLWTFGDAAKYDTICHYGDVIFAQVNREVDPCAVGAQYKLAGSNYEIIKTDYGWDRRSCFGAACFHYPVLQVIDGHGSKTEWFQNYENEVTRTQCPWNFQTCRINKYASTNQLAACLRSTGR